MLMFFKKIKKNRKGYTLTELIVVVAILGILAAVATPMIMNQVGTSRTNADATSARAIETAVQLCLADGTLVMSATTPSLITLPAGVTSSSTDNIGIRVQAKLTGNAYPPRSVTSTNVWILNLANGQVTNGADGSATGNLFELN